MTKQLNSYRLGLAQELYQKLQIYKNLYFIVFKTTRTLFAWAWDTNSQFQPWILNFCFKDIALKTHWSSEIKKLHYSKLKDTFFYQALGIKR